MFGKNCGCGGERVALSLTRERVHKLISEVQELYCADSTPWIVGYSGGKDSTAAIQLVWMAVAQLPTGQRRKPIHVISTDTLVEQPLVAAWVEGSLNRMRAAAAEQGVPVEPHRLTPRIENSFWVCLIGRGYAAPRPGYRWCTERLKIEPSNRFIKELTGRHGRSILVLGTRKGESAARRANMERYEKLGSRERLVPNGNLPGSYIYTPLADWSTDDVWFFLMQWKNPWGQDNKTLLTLYRSASDDAECPLIIDSSQPSCGNSRFGCFICTYVSRDRSMEALVRDHPEHSWMAPLLELRNELGRRGDNGRIADHHLRDWRRADGRVMTWSRDPNRLTPGPYTREARHYWLRRVLEVQEKVRSMAPPEFQGITIIRDEELRLIRRIWLEEKYEWEDALPVIYEQVTGKPYPYMDDIADPGPLGRAEWQALRSACTNEVQFELVYSVAAIVHRYRDNSRVMFRKLIEAIRKCRYEKPDEAIRAIREQTVAGVTTMQAKLDLGTGA